MSSNSSKFTEANHDDSIHQNLGFIKTTIGEKQFTAIQENLSYLINVQPEKSNDKKKRNKHQIPLNERCLAKKSGGQQCTRRKKHEHDFCGTHMKGTPHGETNDTVNHFKKINVFAEDIDGIICYIDDAGNVYNSEDVYQQINNPRIISKYTKDNENKISLVNG
jgi:hypothetical protein